MTLLLRSLAALGAPVLLTLLIRLLEADWPRPYSYQYLALSAVFALWGLVPATACTLASAAILSMFWDTQQLHDTVAFVLTGIVLGLFGERARRRDAQLARQITRLRTVLDVLPVGVMIADADGTITQENRKARDIWEQGDSIAGDEVKGFTPEGRRLRRDDWTLARALRHGRAYSNEEVHIETTAGRHKSILNSAAPIVEDGEITGAVAAVADITERVEFKREIMAREEMFRTFFERLHEFAYILRPVRTDGTVTDWRVVDANELSARQLFRRARREECVGALLSELTSPEFVQSRTTRFLRALESIDPVQYEGDLGELTALVTVFRFTSDTIGVTALDVSSLKRAEDRAQRERAQLEAVFEAMQDGVTVFDASGRAIYLNSAQARIVGYPDVASMQRDIDYFASTFELYEAEGGRQLPVTEWPVSRVLRGERVSDWQLFVRRLDTGASWNVSFSGAPVLDDHGRVSLGVVITRDITAQQQGEEALRRAEEQSRRRAEELETLMNVVPVAIWVSHDPECREIVGNRTANEFYEAGSSENVSASTLPEVRRFFSDGRELSPEELPMQFAALHDTEVHNSEVEVLLPSGRWLVMLGSASPLRDDTGIVRGCLGAFLDITERKRSEQRLQELNRELAAANRQKDEFLATVSHELRTPLNVVLGHTRMLRSRPIRPEDAENIKRSLSVIERNAAAQLRLIEDLLDIHRITLGRFSVEYGPFNLQRLGQNVIDSLTPAASLKSLQISSMLEPIQMHGDGPRIQQVLWNLLSNAIKFTPDGGRIEISATRTGREVVVRVADTGEGIPAYFLPHVFDRFRQLDQSVTRRHLGMGLGLTLVKHIVDLHGGQVTAESPGEGLGATFTVTLPVEAHPAPPARDEAAADNV